MADITVVDDLCNENARDLTVYSTDLKDSYMDEVFNTVNFGTSPTMDVGLTAKEGDEYRIICLYDLANAIPADVPYTDIVSAYWHGYINQNTLIANPANAYEHVMIRCTRTDWHEGYVSWDNYKQNTPWTTPGGDQSTPSVTTATLDNAVGANTWWKTDILDLVKDARQNRSDILTFIFKRLSTSTEEGSVRFNTKDYSVAYPIDRAPHVRITYTLDSRIHQVFIFDGDTPPITVGFPHSRVVMV